MLIDCYESKNRKLCIKKIGDGFIWVSSIDKRLAHLILEYPLATISDYSFDNFYTDLSIHSGLFHNIHKKKLNLDNKQFMIYTKRYFPSVEIFAVRSKYVYLFTPTRISTAYRVSIPSIRQIEDYDVLSDDLFQLELLDSQNTTGIRTTDYKVYYSDKDDQVLDFLDYNLTDASGKSKTLLVIMNTSISSLVLLFYKYICSKYEAKLTVLWNNLDACIFEVQIRGDS